MQPARQEQINQWNQLVAANPDGGNVLQVKAFGESKARHGWQVRYFMIEKAAVLVLVRNIPGLGEFWYVPKGPGVTDLADLKQFAGSIPGPKPFLVKIDPEIPSGSISQK